MKIIRLLIFVLLANNSFSQKTEIDSLFNEFKKASFYENVYPSKIALENHQREIIPQLIKLLNDTTFVKLTGTADLIYPGAKEYYGHGHYIPYALDWISIRAGWLLEELSFQNFGYKTKNIHDLNWEDGPERGKLKESRKLQVNQVEKWWKLNKAKWTRLESLKAALASDDEDRITATIQFLGFGETKCEGLTTEVFLHEIKPLLLKLRNSQNQAIREIAASVEGISLDNWLRKRSNRH